ncbi:MAG: hypothetical protein KAU99_01700 [Thermoplasmata archaeon]|nr:hypothetical protein [Thermoplasmata archaeon]
MVTQAPRKLFVLLRDVLEEAGYSRISSESLRVIGQTIAGTGKMRGQLLAETRPRDILLPWRALRIVGWFMIVIGVLLLLREVSNYISTGAIDYYLFLLAVVLSLLGAKLPGLNRFSSNFIWIDVQGEAFPSSLGEGTAEIPGTLPIVGDLRIRIKGASAISRNMVTRRKLLRISDSAEIEKDFRRVVDVVTRRVLPGVRVTIPIELVREEPPPPPDD